MRRAPVGEIHLHRLDDNGLLVAFAGNRYLLLREYPNGRNYGPVMRWLVTHWLRLVTVVVDAPALLAAGVVAQVGEGSDLTVMTLTHVGRIDPDTEEAITKHWSEQQQSRPDEQVH